MRFFRKTLAVFLSGMLLLTACTVETTSHEKEKFFGRGDFHRGPLYAINRAVLTDLILGMNPFGRFWNSKASELVYGDVGKEDYALFQDLVLTRNAVIGQYGVLRRSFPFYFEALDEIEGLQGEAEQGVVHGSLIDPILVPLVTALLVKSNPLEVQNPLGLQSLQRPFLLSRLMNLPRESVALARMPLSPNGVFDFVRIRDESDQDQEGNRLFHFPSRGDAGDAPASGVSCSGTPVSVQEEDAEGRVSSLVVPVPVDMIRSDTAQLLADVRLALEETPLSAFASGFGNFQPLDRTLLARVSSQMEKIGVPGEYVAPLLVVVALVVFLATKGQAKVPLPALASEPQFQRSVERIAGNHGVDAADLKGYVVEVLQATS